MDYVKKIFIANDHAGFPLKAFLMSKNKEQNWVDLGVFNEQKSDYPEQAEKLCQHILENTHSDNFPFGVLICGSGQGMAIKANRFLGIRAIIAWNEQSARLAREHNKANVLCLGARLIPFETAHNIFKIFINTSFAGGHHSLRVQNLDKNTIL